MALTKAAEFEQYINNYEQMQNNTQKEGKAEKTALTKDNLAELESKATRAYDVTEATKKVLSNINDKRQMFAAKPKYFKPAFLLEYLSPRIHAKIYLQQNGETKKFDLFNDTKKASLDDMNPQATHNYIKSFTYTLFGEGNLQGIMELIDVDNSLAEAFVIRYQILSSVAGGDEQLSGSTVTVEVEYGWSVPEELQEKYSRTFGNSATVTFTRTVLFNLIKPTLKYNMDGTISCTLTLTADPGRSSPFVNWLPYRELGRYPIANIAMTTFLTTMLNTYTKCKVNKTDLAACRKFIANFGTWIYLEYMDGSSDLTDLWILLDSIIALLELPSNLKSADICLRSDLEETAKSFFGAKVEETDAAKKENANVDAHKQSQTALEKEYQRLVGANVNPLEILNLTLKSKRYTPGTVPDPKNVYAPLIDPNNSISVFYNSVYVSEIGFYESFSAELKKLEDDPSKAPLLVKYKEFLGKVTPIIINSYIHPYIAERYMTEKFQLKMSQEFGDGTGNDANLVYTSTIKPTNICPLGFYDQLIAGKNLIFSRAEKEAYCHKVSAYSLSPAISWFDAVADTITKQKYMYITDDKESAKLLSGNENIKADDKKKYNIPVNLQCPVFITSNKGAMKNLDVMLKLLDISMKRDDNSVIAQSNNKFETENAKLKDQRDTLQQYLDKAKKDQGNTSTRWVFIMKDLMPGSSIFDRDLGETQLLQAFSFRPNQTENYISDNNNWNPGFPTMWDVNFPDVMSFEPEFDFDVGLRAVTTIMTPLKLYEGKVNVKSVQEIALAKVNELKTQLETVSSADATAPLIKNFKTAVAELRTAEENTNMIKTGDTYPVTINMDFGNSVTNNGSIPEVLAAKKSIQQLRSRMMLEKLAIDVKQKVFGDPSFTEYDSGKFIFNKVVDNAGNMSIFTGVYILNQMVQTINSQGFTTDIVAKLIATDDDSRDAMFNGIYNSDKMKGIKG